MKLGDKGVFLRELISLLPQRVEKDWCELAHAEVPHATVVVVCGFGATSRSVSAMKKRLLKDGFDVIILAMSMADVSDGVLGLSHMAERLRDTVQSLSKKPGPIFIVAHSAGGLIARYFVQQLEGHLYCQGLVTLATPHRGTWVAALGFATHLILKAKVLWEMLPVSKFIRQLNSSPASSTMPVLSIRSKQDLLCPPRSTDLPRPWRGVKNIQSIDLEGLSHMDFLMSKDCYQMVADFLLQRLEEFRSSQATAPSELKVGGNP